MIAVVPIAIAVEAFAPLKSWRRTEPALRRDTLPEVVYAVLGFVPAGFGFVPAGAFEADLAFGISFDTHNLETRNAPVIQQQNDRAPQ